MKKQRAPLVRPSSVSLHPSFLLLAAWLTPRQARGRRRCSAPQCKRLSAARELMAAAAVAAAGGSHITPSLVLRVPLLSESPPQAGHYHTRQLAARNSLFRNRATPPSVIVTTLRPHKGFSSIGNASPRPRRVPSTRVCPPVAMSLNNFTPTDSDPPPPRFGAGTAPAAAANPHHRPARSARSHPAFPHQPPGLRH
jgi:hypothetical protein